MSHSPSAVELTILMPCLNEAETLPTCIRKAAAFLRANDVVGEIVVADNGSTDGSRGIAASEGARVVPAEERGYGAALIAGISAARGRYIIMGDADDSYDFSALTPFLGKLREGYELVMGNRFAGGIARGAMPPLHRYLGNPVLSGIGRILFRSPIGDFHCGLRGFDAGAIRSVNLQTSGMEFASEMVVKATLAGLRIAEVPTSLGPDGRSRPPHLRSWSDGWRHLRFLLIYIPSWLFLYPGVALFVLGLFGTVVLSASDVPLGGVTFGVHTLLYAALSTVVGFEAISFARFITYLGVASGNLRRSKFLEGVDSVLTLERSITLGLVLLVAGLAGSIYALVIWSHAHFGNLSPEQVMRVTIPAVAAVILGVQCALSGFFMYALRHGPGSGARRTGIRVGPDRHPLS